MERKTKINAEEGRQDLFITREFDLPVDLLFKAHVEAEFLEQWMGTKVIKLESRKHGGYEFETSDGKGNVLIKMNGVFHDFIPNKKIVRTFQMAHGDFDAQLEFMEFEPLTEDTSKLTIHMIFKSVEHRAAQLKLPFSYGINMAHDALEKIANKLK
ncbi:MAG TPA: SRPBCC domain-containing protein [Chitinophagaceae bacterium]|jgi:uncharacterized protein YndB with AHSA1/START domain|nr:SRPBCC domain-containing protein [Chitinophagaceae bacterium]